MFLGLRVLVSRAFSGQLPPFPLVTSLSRLVLAWSATPSRSCYKQLGLQFAVEENFSTRHGRFLHSLLSLEAS